MYCVKCGVKLQDGDSLCPLCNTPVWNPDGETERGKQIYGEEYPRPKSSTKYIAASIVTAIMISVCLSVLIFCLNNYNSASWSGVVMLGIALLFIVFVLPTFIHLKNPLALIAIDFAALGGYLIFINGYSGGHWFLSLAFPLLGLYFLISSFAYVLYKYIKGSRLLKTGILLIIIGSSFMLVEFFIHITFKTGMFVWSLYPVCALGAIGLLFIIAYIIPPLRAFFTKKFFY